MNGADMTILAALISIAAAFAGASVGKFLKELDIRRTLVARGLAVYHAQSGQLIWVVDHTPVEFEEVSS